MKVEFTEENIKNLSLFLNRLKYKGLTEVAAVSDIVAKLNKPIVDQLNKNQKESEKSSQE